MTLQNYFSYVKQILKVAFPIVVAEAGTQLTHLVDTMMVGRVNALYLAASSLANYIYLVPLLFGMGITMSVTPITGDANGKNDLDECKRIFSNAMYLQFAIAIILTGIILSLGLFFPYIDSDTEKIRYTQSYFNFLALSTFPQILMFAVKQYLDGFGYTAYGMLAILLGNVVNIFLNWVFIYGNLGAPALALDGAGIATLCSRIFAFIALILFVISIPKLRKIVEVPRIAKLSTSYIKEFFRVGIHIGIQASVEIAAFSLIVIFAGWLGTVAVAAYQITISTCQMAYLSAMGIGAAATIIISNYKGAGEIRRLIESSRVILSLTLIFTFICTILLVALRFVLPPLFVNEVEVISVASTLLLMLGSFQIADGMNVTFVGVLRGLLDTKIPMIINSSVFWGIMIPLAYILAFVAELGIYGIMAGVCVGILLDAIVIFFRYKWALRNVRRGVIHSLKPNK
jgi:MATE family multidrug resistance protein